MRIVMSAFTFLAPVFGPVAIDPSPRGLPGVELFQAVAVSVVHPVASVLAQVDVSPSTDGLPGADLFQRILNWLGQIALWGSLGSLLAGAGTMWAGNQTANFNWSSKGKTLAVAGLIGACVAGVAPTAVNLLFDAARS
ncbi:MAG: hypothetical protein ACRDY6_08280 [Acidimicrobiia bacterium]